MNRLLRTALALGASAIATLAAHGPLAAQTDDARPTYIAMPNAFPELDARALILREPTRDVIVLRPDGADQDALRAALDLLARVRSRAPAPPAGRAHLIPLTGFAFTEEPAPDDRAWLRSTLTTLASRPEVKVGNLGPGRWIRYTPRR
jgi:hypothetical protein